MSVAKYLQEVPLPKMVRVAQSFPSEALQDIPQAICTELRRPDISCHIKKGMSIALAVGSRGMDNLVPLVRTIVTELTLQGAEPFIVPSMGSHGGASAEGQVALLAELGITEQSVACPIKSSMDTVEIAKLPNGLPVLMDAIAMQADGIIPINRIKPHTGFSSSVESGVVKMLSIGLGKHKGAESCHAQGYKYMGQNIVEMAKIKLEKCPILFGIATIENAYDKVAKIAALPKENFIACEEELLKIAKSNMPCILFNPLDVLIVDCMGKEYSGTGMDPSITGRANTPYVNVSQKTTCMAVLNLRKKSKGNAAGIGLADVTTRRLFEKINLDAMYINHLTSTALSGGMIPLIMETDKLAIQACLHSCNILDPSQRRLVRIPNTLHLGEIFISENLLAEAQAHSQITILDEPKEWAFDTNDNLAL